MENTEKQMSYDESIVLIQSMINTARLKVADDGFHLILWGVLVIICSLLNYFLYKAGYTGYGSMPWVVMPFIGVPAGIYYEKSIKGKGHVKTLIDTHIAYMWWSYGVALFLAIACSITMQVSPIPYILLITGMITFASGLMLRFGPMIAGGVAFWILTILCFFVQPLDQLLLEAVGVLVGYIIPGVILRKKAKEAGNV